MIIFLHCGFPFIFLYYVFKNLGRFICSLNIYNKNFPLFRLLILVLIYVIFFNFFIFLSFFNLFKTIFNLIIFNGLFFIISTFNSSCLASFYWWCNFLWFFYVSKCYSFLFLHDKKCYVFEFLWIFEKKFLFINSLIIKLFKEIDKKTKIIFLYFKII